MKNLVLLFALGKNIRDMRKYIYMLVCAVSVITAYGQTSLEASIGYDYIGLSKGLQNGIGFTRSVSCWNFGVNYYTSKSIGFNSHEASQRSNIIKLPNSEPLDLGSQETIELYMNDLASSGLFAFNPVTYSYYVSGIEMNLQYDIKLGQGWSISPRVGVGLGYYESSYLASWISVTSINAPAISDPSNLIIYQSQYESYLALPLSTYLLLTKEFRNNLKLSVFSSLNVQREMIRSSAFNIKVSVPLRLGSIKTD